MVRKKLNFSRNFFKMLQATVHLNARLIKIGNFLLFREYHSDERGAYNLPEQFEVRKNFTCVALFEDQGWHRAVMTGKKKRGQFEVRFQINLLFPILMPVSNIVLFLLLQGLLR